MDLSLMGNYQDRVGLLGLQFAVLHYAKNVSPLGTLIISS